MKKNCLLLAFCILVTSFCVGCYGDDINNETSLNSRVESSEVQTSKENDSNQESSLSTQSSEAQTSEEVDEDAYQRDLKIYTEYLLDGGYEDIYLEGCIADEIENDCTIYTKLFDFDCVPDGVRDDNVYELLITIYGIGAEHTTTLLTIKDGKPTVMFRTENWGGSIGGEYMDVYWDTQLQKFALNLKSLTRDGLAMSIGTSKYFTADNQYSEPTITTYSCSIDPDGFYSSEISDVKSETDIYEESSDLFSYYKVDGEYVTKEDYEKASERFVDNIDYDLTQTKCTYNTPIV